jgi:hypothetical protein
MAALWMEGNRCRKRFIIDGKQPPSFRWETDDIQGFDQIAQVSIPLLVDGVGAALTSEAIKMGASQPPRRIIVELLEEKFLSLEMCGAA